MNIKPLTNPDCKYKIISDGIIEGYWNEDNSPFRIECPAQLTEMILNVLNNLEVNEVRIKKSSNCDTRSADKKVSEAELLNASKQHIEDVRNAILWMISLLRNIGEKHDYTKIENIKEFYNNFKFIQDGNVAEFKKLNWFQNHHLKERHHLTDKCPDDVNLFDVLERIADITTAGIARTGEVFDDNLSPDILIKAYKNTIELLKSKIKEIK